MHKWLLLRHWQTLRTPFSCSFFLLRRHSNKMTSTTSRPPSSLYSRRPIILFPTGLQRTGDTEPLQDSLDRHVEDVWSKICPQFTWSVVLLKNAWDRSVALFIAYLAQRSPKAIGVCGLSSGGCLLAVIWPDRILVGSCDHKYLRNHPPTHCAVSWLASLMFFTRIINFMIPMWDRSIVLTQDSNKTGGLYSTFIKTIITTWFGAGLFTLTGIGFAPFSHLGYV